jgi:hypothetical protein
MGHTQMDLVLACLDDYALEQLVEQLRVQVYEREPPVAGYERDRLVSQYLGVVVEREIRRVGAADPSSGA